jgi:hypothetical protein
MKDPRIHLVIQENQGAHAALTDMLAELLLLGIARSLNEDDNPTRNLVDLPEVAEPSTPPP